MPKQTIVRVVEDSEPYLAYKETTWETIVDEHPTPALEELADMCDQNAESRNNGDYIGVHRILAALLYRQLRREQATMLMKEIAEYGGLDRMNGVSGQDDAFADFGIENGTDDWQLPD